MSALFARVETPADTTGMKRAQPGFGLASVITHFWHPNSWVDGSSDWTDEIGSRGLTVSGDNSITRLYQDGTPYLRLTTTAAFAEGTDVPPAEVLSLFCVARVNTADAIVTNGTIINNGRSSIQMNTVGSPTVSFTDGLGGVGTAALDKWHLFSLTGVASDLKTRFTVDTTLFTAVNASAGLPRSVRVGTTVPSKRQMDVACVFTTSAEVAAATITGSVFPLVKEWWPDLEWAV